MLKKYISNYLNDRNSYQTGSYVFGLSSDVDTLKVKQIP
jgi:hypothetical protein